VTATILYQQTNFLKSQSSNHPNGPNRSHTKYKLYTFNTNDNMGPQTKHPENFIVL